MKTSRVRTVILAALVLAAAACSRPVDVTVSYEMTNVLLGEGTRMEILADGKPVAGRLTKNPATSDSTYTFEAHGTLAGETFRPPVLTMKVTRGCGERVLSVESATPPSAEFIRARLHVFEDVGHFSPWEKPREVNTLMRGFLSRSFTEARW